MSLSEIIAVILGVVALITIILYVIMMRAEHTANHTKIERVYICPSCGAMITLLMPEYCQCCGQKLDWRGAKSNEDND